MKVAAGQLWKFRSNENVFFLITSINGNMVSFEFLNDPKIGKGWGILVNFERDYIHVSG